MDDDDFRIHGKGIQSISDRVLSQFSTRDNLGDLSILKFFDDFFQAVVLIFLANHKEDGPDEGTGVELIKSMGEDRSSPQGEELFLSSLHESLTLASRDDDSIGFHQCHTTCWNIGIMEDWENDFSNIPSFHYSIIPNID